MISRAFLFVLFLAAAPAFADSGAFCVQTFNVYGPAYASNVSWRLSRLAEEVVKEPCAATQFQEFWREKHFEQFKQELGAARLASIFADDIRQDGYMIGLASAFAGSVLDAKSALFRVNNEGGVLDWVRSASGVQKGYTLLDVKLDRAPTILFANVHTHPTDESIRVAQMAQLVLALWQSPADQPLVLNGDLNAIPGGPEIDLLTHALLLRDTFVEANKSYGDTCTYCAKNPLSWSYSDRVIDFVLVRNSAAFALVTKKSEVNLQGNEDGPLSDHYGVRSSFSWQDRASALLAPTDLVVTERITKALVAMERAENILRTRDDDETRALADELAGKMDELRRGNLPNFFLVP